MTHSRGPLFGRGARPRPNMLGTITPHFTWREARCSCCLGVDALVNMDVHETARKLEQLRSLAGGRSLRVASWYRCLQHPHEARKREGALHRHTTGRAVDLHLATLQYLDVVERVREAGFTSCGFYSWGIHVDWVDGDVARYWRGE